MWFAVMCGTLGWAQGKAVSLLVHRKHLGYGDAYGVVHQRCKAPVAISIGGDIV